MRQQQKTQSQPNTSIRSTYSKDEQEQIAQLEQNWLERQMYLNDDRGYYCV